MPGEPCQLNVFAAGEGLKGLGCDEGVRITRGEFFHATPHQSNQHTRESKPMKTKNKRLGLSILAGGLSFVGAANAMDLIVNGSFESANAGEWKFFSTYNYSAQYFTGAAIPGTETPGSKYSWKH